ncbi:GNAT family N-acetyltransferase [Nocardia camponoti]|uniref:ElaA protein n=1 Tax=Nocardia camponoti TaxID=1616106 RepID=A0A917QBG7_9NOCA|nr:GNAT family N-acetyltransferase [Nocardia camponoti]GGK42307.1 ElaA protein [Nocardia camponoti]
MGLDQQVAGVDGSLIAGSGVILRQSSGTDLSVSELYALLRLRSEVFVVEQECNYIDADGLDLLADTQHLWLERDGEVIAALRLLAEPDEVRIGRVCTAQAERGQGHIDRLMKAALTEIGSGAAHLHAQSYLVGMYGKYGFVVDGPEFDDVGIPHTPMRRAGTHLDD